ncbi:MAG: proton-translocating NADH-quinone oxidoreductase, chain [Solirubrobacterales bacterium]|nr:proton-translocating NADH-quinone oxidoreductase, chain [Solirubrobacterales bacterium]
MSSAFLSLAASTGKIKGPHIDWAGLSPLVAILGGVVVVLMAGLLRPRFAREQLVPGLALVSLLASLGLTIWQLDEDKSLVANSLRLDGLSTTLTVIFLAAGIATTLLSWRALAPRESAHGEYFALMLTSIAGMIVLVWAQDTITLFLGLELLSIPLYVLCATEMRRASSLESGLKYLVVGSVGSATLLYGLALIYGATGSTGYAETAQAFAAKGLSSDTLALGGIALVVVGMCFKASVAPFHQWTPDVYQGAPTPVTAFMAVATKAAAFGVFLRFFDVALIDAQSTWGPALAALATITIIVGNVGALGQSSLKRMLAYSSVAQAGYMLAGVVVSTQLGVRATVFYLAAYLVMNLAAFGVIIARERETGRGDDISAVTGIGASRPLLAWPLTISMLALAGVPATAGFIGKFQLIRATVDGDYAWLGIVIVVGSMISLGYYLKVIAAIWSTDAVDEAPATAGGSVALPALAGGAPDGPVTAPPAKPAWELTLVSVVFGAAIVVIGVLPQPLFDFVERASSAFANLV